MPDGAPTSIYVGVETGSQSISLGEAVTRLEREAHDRLIDEARITLDDSFDLAGANLANGFAVTIWLGWGDTRVKMFTGTIAQLGGEVGSDADAGSTTVVVRDPSRVMHETNSNVSAEADETLQQLVERVAAIHSGTFAIGEVECNPNPTFERANLPRQLDRTDFQFLQQLARTWGHRCFVEINDDEPKFYFKSIQTLWAADPMGELQLCRGYGTLMSFKYERIAARAVRQLVSAALDPVTGDVVVADSGPVVSTPPPMGSVSSSVREQEPALASAQERLAGAVATVPPTPPPPGAARGGSSDVARARNYVIVDPTQASGLRAEARSLGHVDLRAKGRVKLSGMAPWAEGDWWVKRVTHTVVPGRTAAGRTSSTTYECHLELTR